MHRHGPQEQTAFCMPDDKVREFAAEVAWLVEAAETYDLPKVSDAGSVTFAATD